jgi:hypothetical protein
MFPSMLSRVYYWLQNAIRFLWENIRDWCVICDVSNMTVNSGSLRNLPFKVESWTSRYFWYIICDLSRNISVVPNPQFPLNTELITTSLDSSSLHPTCSHFSCPMPGVFVHGHHYVSWQWWVTVKFRWYPLPGRKFELPILTYDWWPHPLPPPPWTPSRTHTGTVILSAPMDTIVSYTFSSTIQYNSSFFFIFSIFFSLKMWFDVTLSRWGDQLKWTGFECH